MKTFLPLILCLLSISFLSAQDLSLPKGSSTIYLYTGKIIKSVTLWRMDSVKVEYVLKGNLADLKTLDVSKIETPDYLIEFDLEHHMTKKSYDVIILSSKDTVRGIIQRIDDGVISYRPVGSDKVKRAMKYEVESYSQWKGEGTSMPDSLAQNELVPMDEDESGEPQNVEDNVSNEEKEFYYHQSYERGVKDALVDKDKSAGWAGEGFILGMTVGSPFLFLGAANSKVKVDKIPVGVDEKLYKAAYQNEIVKKRSKRAAAGAIAGKFLILIILITSL